MALKGKWLVAVLLLVPFLVGGNSEAQSDPVQDEYLLVPGDKIEILVEGSHDLGGIYTVPAEGHVSLPSLGKIKLVGKSLPRIEKEIKQALVDQEIYVEPKVRCALKAHAPGRAYVVGAVYRAIELSPTHRLTLLKVLAIAAVDPKTADLSKVVVRRKSKGKAFEIPVDVNTSLSRGSFDIDIVIMPGDLIHVPMLDRPADPAQTVYVLGAVNRSGKYGYEPSRDKMKLTSLIAMAGDFRKDAEVSRVRILRQTRSGTEVIKLDFADIVDRKIEDPELQPGDLVYVPEKR